VHITTLVVSQRKHNRPDSVNNGDDAKLQVSHETQADLDEHYDETLTRLTKWNSPSTNRSAWAASNSSPDKRPPPTSTSCHRLHNYPRSLRATRWRYGRASDRGVATCGYDSGKGATGVTGVGGTIVLPTFGARGRRYNENDLPGE